MSRSGTAERPRPRTPFASPKVFVLAGVEGGDHEAIHRLSRSETVLGRAGNAHVTIDDPEVSARHCVVRVDGGVCSIMDLGSRNGTRVNGRDLREGLSVRLRHLDEIEIGGIRMIVLTGRFREAPRTV